jgi:hypothetical protein
MHGDVLLRGGMAWPMAAELRVAMACTRRVYDCSCYVCEEQVIQSLHLK